MEESIRVLKWLATALCVMCMLLTAVNLYPVNVLFGVLGNWLWMVAGWKAKDTPLWVSSAISTSIFAGGLLYAFYNFFFRGAT